VNAEYSRGAWRLTISNQWGLQTLQARTIGLAVGRDGWLVRQLGATTGPATREVAVLAILSDPNAAWVADPLLLVESIPSGWGYGLIAPSGRGLVGLCVRTDQISQRLNLLSMWRHYCDQSELLRTAVGSARIQFVEARAAHARQYLPIAGAGWVAVGDAACAPYPLSGHGVTFALESG
jgi:flavin-dependent dehydrogenase